MYTCQVEDKTCFYYNCLLLKFMVLLVTCIHSSSGTILYSVVSNLNGTEGESITIQIIFSTNPFECRTVQWKKNEVNLANSNCITPYEEIGKLLLKIDHLQRLDKGYYTAMCDDLISPTIFLNIIGIPAPQYPTILLEKRNECQLEVICISENTLPRPKPVDQWRGTGFS
ncbi:uncharacterized protein LOC117107768 isoform X1 [Anneissia japonica]|uniref:uncharacterized protein LOC117107768 isoform X1 n=1 Tax=Anneissia japonica TaxID=1529436 RepID=UPI00142570CF|nr:uncharacterized protein LOC117107768 isoform X1 [Anneissia japonica]